MAGHTVAGKVPRLRPSDPVTLDGQPDLQGYWTDSTYVPLERPDKVTKTYYTEAEFAALVKDAASREQEQTEPGTVADVHYDFTQFGLDRSQSAFVKSDLRTSMIVEPANGKMPALTEEGKKRAQVLGGLIMKQEAPADSLIPPHAIAKEARQP
jgi:hypothetical protein